MGYLVPPPPPPRDDTEDLRWKHEGWPPPSRALAPHLRVVVYQGPALVAPPPLSGIIPGRPATGYTRRNAPPQRPPRRKIASACDLLARCVPYPDLAGPLTQPADDRPVWPLLYDEV